MSHEIDKDLARDNRRREELNRQRREGLSSPDPAERAKWQARDAAWCRGFGSPDGGL